MEDVMVPCKKCGNKAPASSMKLDLDERLMICPDCVKNKKIHKEIKEEVFHKKEEQVIPRQAVQEEATKKIGHKCTSCGYKFMINPETRSPKNCPYCNSRIMSF